jgi:hypothetical protein
MDLTPECLALRRAVSPATSADRLGQEAEVCNADWVAGRWGHIKFANREHVGCQEGLVIVYCMIVGN